MNLDIYLIWFNANLKKINLFKFLKKFLILSDYLTFLLLRKLLLSRFSNHKTAIMLKGIRMKSKDII